VTPLAAAVTLILLFTLGFAAVCAASPFGNCRKCRGFGFKVTTDRHGRIERGRRCYGVGKRIRIGRRLFNRAACLHPDGSR
jgi:hypothetical protein